MKTIFLSNSDYKYLLDVLDCVYQALQNNRDIKLVNIARKASKIERKIKKKTT